MSLGQGVTPTSMTLTSRLSSGLAQMLPCMVDSFQNVVA